MPGLASTWVTTEPLDARPTARSRLRHFYGGLPLAHDAVGCGYAGPEGWSFDQSPCFRHLAVSNTLAALDAQILWDLDEMIEMQRRVLLLRRTSAESISGCMEGRPTALRVKQLRMDTPPPLDGFPLEALSSWVAVRQGGRPPGGHRGQRAAARVPLLLPMGGLRGRHRHHPARWARPLQSPQVSAHVQRLQGQICGGQGSLRLLPPAPAGGLCPHAAGHCPGPAAGPQAWGLLWCGGQPCRKDPHKPGR